jgi:hypothetical protein
MWKCGSVEVWKYGSMEVWKYGSIESRKVKGKSFVCVRSRTFFLKGKAVLFFDLIGSLGNNG